MPGEPPPPPKRPGPMLLTAVAALLLTGALGTAAELGRGAGAAEARAAEQDDATRADLAAIGFETEPTAAELRRRHGVELMTATRPFLLALGNGPVAGEPPRDEARETARRVLERELGRFPPGLLERIGLWRVVLCRGLTEDGRSIPSLPNYRHTLLFDTEGSPAFLRRLIHHEVFHFADYAEDLNVLHDPAWEALNPPEFHYGTGGRDMRSPRVTAFDDHLPGFVSRYGTSALEEDKAEIFAALLAAPAWMAEQRRRDPILEAKARRVQLVMEGLFPGLETDFWAKLEGSDEADGR